MLAGDLDAARTAAREEPQRRCADNEPYSGVVTVNDAAARIGGCAARRLRASLSAWDGPCYGMSTVQNRGMPLDLDSLSTTKRLLPNILAIAQISSKPERSIALRSGYGGWASGPNAPSSWPAAVCYRQAAPRATSPPRALAIWPLSCFLLRAFWSACERWSTAPTRKPCSIPAT